MNFNDYMKKTDICFTNDDFELQASFDNEKSAQFFAEYLKTKYGENEQAKTDFRGMPFLKFKMDDKNEIVLCGNSVTGLQNVLSDYITLLMNPVSEYKYNPDDTIIKTITW